MLRSSVGSIFSKMLYRSWWVLAFLCLIVSIYFQAAHRQIIAESQLTSRTQAMENEKRIATHQQEDLMSRLQSSSDPAWIELVLMKELGVVPEGWVKVRFTGTR